MVIALFAALIAPWFINWDDYKANFEAEAARILGQPVRVAGSADASILPSPSLTFTDVEVGETEGQPMMKVKRFSVTIELMPLIQGEIRVIAMKLEEPVVRVSIDDAGQVDWTIRGEASRDLDPDKVALSGVEITDGTLIYNDSRSGASVTLTDIAATVEARSLAGPWRFEGSYATDGVPAQFQIATGVRDEDGSLRVKLDVTPGHWPIAIGADGVIAQSDSGPTYSGTYSLTQILPPVEGEEGRGDATGWRSEGSFNLTREQLVVDKAVLSEGPPDRPSSLAGSMTLTLGPASRFFATVQARQLDLDRSLGKGPKEPIEMATAAEEFVKWLRGIPVPAIAGTVRFNVPAIVVGGAVIQDVSFTASPEDHGWLIEGLSARLPGQASFAADGRLSTGEAVGFGGQVRLAVGQPATFAAWWRGKSEVGAGRLLSPFDLSGRATVTMTGVAVEDMTTEIGDATITGSFSWAGAGKDSPLRTLRTNLDADRLDFVQIRALAELLGGRDLRDTSTVADSFQIKFTADELLIEELVMRDVSVDAGFENGGLMVSGIEVGDIGGARFVVTRGQIDNIFGEPLGRMEAQLTAQTLTGLAGVVDRLAPDTAFARWFRDTAPALAPASIALVVDSFMDEGRPNSRLDVKGSAKATNFDATVELAGVPALWRQADVNVSASLKSYDAVGVARQIGLDEGEVAIDGGAQFRFTAKGVPDQGLASEINGAFGGLTLKAGGDFVAPVGEPPRFTGAFNVDTPDLSPLIRLVGLDIPDTDAGVPVSVSGKIATAGRTADLDWQNAAIAGRQVSGRLRLAEGLEGGLSLENGAIELDQLDLGWVASLALGFAPLPSGDPEEPWSRTPYGEAALDGLTAGIDISAERLLVGEALQVLNSKARLGLAPDRVDFDVKSGDALGGTVAGGFSVRNVGGNASLTGNVSLVGGALDSVVWQRAGRAVAVGTLDLSANFEATGRSPAGMIASLTGGGTLGIHDGEARYLNPKAGVLVIRDSDLGQEFTEDALRDLLGSYIDNGSLTFPEVEAPFAIAAGTVRFQNIAVAAEETRASGSAAIDLNTMTIESDWTLTLDPGDDRFGGDIPPQVGIVFRGPLATPERILDVLQFNSYLAIRQEARLQEILALEEQARLENAFFNRLKRKLREDQDRAARLAEEARQARIAYATNLEALHATREIASEKKAEDE
ncbi:MAG TPA: AsmA-like C-terminal region-containing protein, partial [Bauldia sp.]|nr:AsmA-like C-terminal region-containing protein [Bauldia sp.]